MNMGNDDLGDSKMEMKFIPKILPRNDEETPTNVNGEEKFDSAKTRHSSFTFKPPIIDGMTHLCMIQQLCANNSKLKVRNQKLKTFTAAMTLSFLSTLVVMGCFLYLHFNTNAKLDTIQPKACDECRMQLSLQAKVLANLSLQIEAIQHLSQRGTDTHNLSEVTFFGLKNWSGKPILNWD